MLPSSILESSEYQEFRTRFCAEGFVEAEPEKKEAYAIIAANAQIFSQWEKLVAECREVDRKILLERGLNAPFETIGLIDRLCFDPDTQTVFIERRQRHAPKLSDRLRILDKLDHGREAMHLFIRYIAWEEIANALLEVRD